MNWVPAIEAILSEYEAYIEQKRGNIALKKFQQRRENNNESATSEALIFNWLCGAQQNPELNENESTGGADFICRPSKDYQFIVEVTCIGSQALVDETGCHMHSGQSMILGSPTRLLRQRVTEKAKQLAGYDIPTVLVIASLHPGASMLFTPDEAISILVSDWAFTFPIGGGADSTYLSTDLKHSIFFKFSPDEPSKITPCRQSISAVLLVPISGDSLAVTGILHPEPVHSFSIQALKKVPFVRVQNWPIKDGVVLPEWVVSDPYAHSFQQFPRIKRMT